MERESRSIKVLGKALLLQGKSTKEVAEILGCTQGTIQTYNKKFWKVPLAKKMSSEECEKAKEMIIKQYTYAEIGETLGYAAATIQDHNKEEWRLPYREIQIHKKLVKRVCQTCGKEFYVRQQKLKHDACSYCCKKCSHLGAIKPNKVTEPIFRGYRWAYLSKEVRSEVPFCERCFSTHKRLVVHHIKPWNKGGKSERDNLLVLCDSCHKKLENASIDMIHDIGLDTATELIKNIFSYRMERIVWNLTRLRKPK